MAGARLELFGMPSSFYTLKVGIALEEKGIPYTRTTVTDFIAPEYLRVNPLGQVPAIKVGQKVMAGSDDIIEFLETMGDKDVHLIPDPRTLEGQLVTQWRQRIDGLSIKDITFGVLFNPSLSISGLQQLPVTMNPDAFKENVRKAIARLEGFKTTEPDLKEACDVIIARNRQNLDGPSFEEGYTRKLLDDLEPLFDDAENLLKQNAWLCGSNFTVADIHLTVLLRRLDEVGVQKRYTATRPALTEYWDRASKRPSVKKCCFDLIAAFNSSDHPTNRNPNKS